MLLTVDIGNSHITIGGYAQEHNEISTTLFFTARFVTNRHKTDDEYAMELSQLLKIYEINPQDICDIMICSVVPELNTTLQSAFVKAVKLTPTLLGPGMKTGLNILIDNPAQLGADMVASAVAIIAYYPLPCVLFDLGTSTTISVIDKHANFLGGSISAGVAINLESLSTRTALLPHVSIEKPKNVVGTNTISAMQSGLIYGTASMLDGMADRIEEELQYKVNLLATGGLASTVIPACKKEITLCETLLLDGLRLIYEKNKNNPKYHRHS